MFRTDINILVVEDNPIDVRMIKMALKQAGVARAPAIFDDGVPALELLRGEGQYAGRILPDMVILDLNLKRVDGPEVLAYIRGTPSLSGLCVAILSSSPSDVMTERAAQANCYFTKPSDLNEFMRIGKNLMDCYLHFAGAT